MATKGVLLEGVKKKIINFLSTDGCSCKTTASLCKQFPVLFFHEDFVAQMASMFDLEETVKSFSKNRIAAPPSPAQDDDAAEAEALAQAEQEGSCD